MDAGHQVTTIFITGKQDESVDARYKGEVIFLQLDHKNPTWRFRAFGTLLGLCRKQHYDAVISHHYKPSAIMSMVDRFCRINKLFMVNHNPGNLRRKGRQLIIRNLFSNRWKFLTVSNSVRKDFINHANGINPERVKTIYNCIDVDTVIHNQLSKNEARQQLNLPSDAFIFGNIHRLDTSKGHDYLIDAFANNLNHMSDAHLVIIGGGRRQAELEQHADNLGIGNNVHLLGLIPEASRYIKAFDIFVIPSLHEGFGLGLLEGMSASIPTLSSTGGALPEVVGNTGLHFPPGDTDELAKQLLAVYSMSQGERDVMGKAGFTRLSENFSKDKYHQNFLALLD